MMRNCRVATLILRRLICGEGETGGASTAPPAPGGPARAPAAAPAAAAGPAKGPAATPAATPAASAASAAPGCGRFLCRGDCPQNAGPAARGGGHASATPSWPAQVERALVHVIACVGGTRALGAALLPALETEITNSVDTDASWGGAFDRRQVWNLQRPPWVDALITPLRPLLQATVATIVASVQVALPPGRPWPPAPETLVR